MKEFKSMMDQYDDIKAKHRNHLLFYRLGDFYELFKEDAEIASRELELTLTARNSANKERVPMCGVPYHSAELHIKRLIQKGYKVAICEQIEDPSKVKGLVSREVVRIITPGTITDDGMLDSFKNNYICSIYVEEEQFGISFADISTGKVLSTQVKSSNVTQSIIDELDRYRPAEILFNEPFVELIEVANHMKRNMKCTGELLGNEHYILSSSLKKIQKQFGDNIKDKGLEYRSLIALSLGALLDYLEQTQKQGVKRLIDLEIYEEEQFMILDITARKNLELLQTYRSGDKQGSLLGVLDKTNTAMGKRLIRQYLERPLLNLSTILKRQSAVAALIQNPVACDDISDSLSDIHDLERLMTKVMYGSVNPREIKSLSATAGKVPSIKRQLGKIDDPMLNELNQKISDMSDIHQLIENAVKDEPPISLKDGGVIRDGFNKELDELRNIDRNGRDYISEIEKREKERTGIKKLKIGYNRVFGYYIEIANSYKDMVPKEYIRKQTLSNCERYIIEELKEYEHKVLFATERSILMEQAIFEELRQYLSERLSSIQETAEAIAVLDVIHSFAVIAMEYHYVCPQINMEGVIDIKDGRHPVVEANMDMPFVPNDTLLDGGKNLMMLITGPNMAGKSTYMRQVALIALMAQMGSFVPASSANLPLIDRIFTRVGASDDLSSGQSTFMVEMSEVADILKKATPNSLIILDEIGRGTSTFDGMSIAQAVIEYLLETKALHAKTLFATHYHELTVLERQFHSIHNFSIAVKKRGDDITFLRKIIPGGADDSYGIAVAKLAGIPNEVIQRAKVILYELEKNQAKVKATKKDDFIPEDTVEIAFEKEKQNDLIKKVREIPLDTLTPIEALNTLFELRKIAN